MQLPPQQLLDALDVGILAADANGVIRFRNAHAARALPSGDSMDEAFCGVRFLGPFDGWKTELDRAVSGGRSASFQCVSPAGPSTRARMYMLRCCPSGRGPQAVVTVLVQATEPDDGVDDRLEVSKRLASLGKLAACVAHELNNPLDGILRYVNLALRLVGDADDRRLRAYLSESRTGLMRMIQIIGELLEFSRATNGGFDVSEINEVIEQAIQSSAAAAAASRVAMAADFQTRPMPAVRGSRLYQVLCNLIRNAVDAMPDGGRLLVTSGVVGADVVIRVSDTGVGLPAEIDRIYEPFYTTKAPGKGTGLGLAICKDYIEEMHGTIHAVPNDPRGAVLTVRIPLSSCVSPGAPRLRKAGATPITGETPAEAGAALGAKSGTGH